MANSEADICNMALSRIGVTAQIQGLDESNDEARLCKTHYAQCRDALLAKMHWPFATKRATLAKLNEIRTGWGYVFAIPSDCVRVREIIAPTYPKTTISLQIQYSIENSGNRAVLLTNEESVEILYTARITSPTLFPPLFVDTLAWLLASELALGLAVKESLEQRARQRFEIAFSRAVASAVNELEMGPEPESELVTGRF